MEVMTATIGISTGSVNGYITGRPNSLVRSVYRAMLKDILARIEKRLEATGQSPTAASKKAGLGEDGIRNLRRAVKDEARQGISTNTLLALAPILETTASWLIEGLGPEAIPKLRIAGSVGESPDGAVILDSSGIVEDWVPVPPGGNQDFLALEVRGHSVRGLAEFGGLVYISDRREPPPPELINHVVLAKTLDDRLLIARLLRGSAPHLYDLETFSGPTAKDCRLDWVAEVVATVRPTHAKRVIVRASA